MWYNLECLLSCLCSLWLDLPKWNLKQKCYHRMWISEFSLQRNKTSFFNWFALMTSFTSVAALVHSQKTTKIWKPHIFTLQDAMRMWFWPKDWEIVWPLFSICNQLQSWKYYLNANTKQFFPRFCWSVAVAVEVWSLQAFVVYYILLMGCTINHLVLRLIFAVLLRLDI